MGDAKTRDDVNVQFTRLMGQAMNTIPVLEDAIKKYKKAPMLAAKAHATEVQAKVKVLEATETKVASLIKLFKLTPKLDSKDKKLIKDMEDGQKNLKLAIQNGKDLKIA